MDNNNNNLSASLRLLLPLLLLAPTVTAAGTSGTDGDRAAPQAGVLEGGNPVAYSASNPISLFIIQAIIIIIFCRLLHYPLSYLNQPRVIAEVIGGVLLGPSVMMRIPGFKDNIFPTASMPVLNNVANLGLIIFLFLVALEVDVRLFTRNWRVALSVGLAGMIVPFGLGFAIAWGLYHQFRLEADLADIDFGVYALFIGTALAITAFPVLCRILTELKLLRSSVGVTVLAAGISNDVTGWILLALCVALVNNASGLAALWALLCTVGWALFLVFGVRPCFVWCLRRTGSLQNGPTQGMVALTLLIVLTSAWFTGIIGVHPIFGAFLAGLICPHEGGFAIKLTEKIEDLISVLFLPLYFALSGLSTNLGLLDNGITWAYVFGVIAIAFSGKIIGGTLAARPNRLEWRESFAIGCLMSCKGLVELIVLNIGLQAGILSQRTFTIFVVMALVTTVATTPLTKWLYPPWYQLKMEKWRRGETDRDGNPISSTPDGEASHQQLDAAQARRLLVYLRLDSLPSIFTFIALLGADREAKVVTATGEEVTEKSEGQVITTSVTASTQPAPERPLEVHGLRILELTERTSSVMQVTEGEDYSYSDRDPVVNAFHAFSRLSTGAAAVVSGKVAVVPESSYAETIVKHASDVSSDFVLIPWSEHGSATEDTSAPFAMSMSSSSSASSSAQDRHSSRAGNLDFISKALENPVCTTGILIDHGPSSASGHAARGGRSQTHHVFLPFLGGPDDRAALRFALQLARNPHVALSVAHLSYTSSADNDNDNDEYVSDENDDDDNDNAGATHPAAAKAAAVDDDVSALDLALISSLRSSLPNREPSAGRVFLNEVRVSGSGSGGRAKAADKAVMSARAWVGGRSPRNWGNIVIIGRRHPGLGDGQVEIGGGELRRTFGVVAERFLDDGRGGGGGGGGGSRPLFGASVLVIKAGGAGLQ